MPRKLRKKKNLIITKWLQWTTTHNGHLQIIEVQKKPQNIMVISKSWRSNNSFLQSFLNENLEQMYLPTQFSYYFIESKQWILNTQNVQLLCIWVSIISLKKKKKTNEKWNWCLCSSSTKQITQTQMKCGLSLSSRLTDPNKTKPNTDHYTYATVPTTKTNQTQ